MHGFVGISETSLKFLSGKTSLRSKVFKVSNLKRMRTCELMCIFAQRFLQFCSGKARGAHLGQSEHWQF